MRCDGGAVRYTESSAQVGRTVAYVNRAFEVTYSTVTAVNGKGQITLANGLRFKRNGLGIGHRGRDLRLCDMPIQETP